MSGATINPRTYHQPLWGTIDRVSRNCLLVAATIGLAVVIAVFVAPRQPAHELTIQEMPERFARLILEKPEPKTARPETAPATVKAPTPVAEAAPPTVAKATPPPAVRKTRPVERREEPKVAADKGKLGREKAQTEVAANLNEVSGALNKVLDELSQALPTAQKDKSQPKAQRNRRRGVRTGRVSTQLAAMDNITGLAQAQVEGSALAGTGITIAAITDLETGGDSAGGTGQATTAGGRTSGGNGEIRSNQTLLAVVRRYAPGIQFCYENELKRSPGLRGKLVVSLTVAADGTVSNAVLVEDTLHSPAVTDCVMAQMNGWRFPAIEAGVVTFKTPFVFTPPE